MARMFRAFQFYVLNDQYQCSLLLLHNLLLTHLPKVQGNLNRLSQIPQFCLLVNLASRSHIRELHRSQTNSYKVRKHAQPLYVNPDPERRDNLKWVTKSKFSNDFPQEHLLFEKQLDLNQPQGISSNLEHIMTQIYFHQTRTQILIQYLDLILIMIEIQIMNRQNKVRLTLFETWKKV